MEGLEETSTKILLKRLIEGQDNMNQKFEQLVAIEAGRVERENNQSVKNDEFKDFIKMNRDALNRLRRTQGHFDKAVGGVWSKAFVAVAIFAAASMAGFNWLS